MAIKKQYPLIRTIYLYLFALIGLAFLISGAVRFVDMGLKAFIFTKAEQEQRLNLRQPTMFYSVQRVESLQDEEWLSEEEKVIIQEWLADYREWKEESSKINYIDTQRHKDASSSMSMILVGLPLYLYHWGVIKTEVRKQENNEQ
jgi:hypothetical protein